MTLTQMFREQQPSCRTCGAPVKTIDIEAVEDELRSAAIQITYRPGAEHHTCVHGHVVRVREDPGPAVG